MQMFLRDPAGNGIFLNTYPDERLRFLAGERASIPGLVAWAGEAGAGMEWQLATPEPQALADWYGLLGMESGPGTAPGSLLLSQGDTLLALDSGLSCNRIVVRTGSEEALQACLQRLADVGLAVTDGLLDDPDGNEVVVSV